MITENNIIEILKEFQQEDFKRGGVSICPTNYNAIASSIVRLVKSESISDVSGSLLTTVLERKTDGFMSCNVVSCCKIGPIVTENYCPKCGKMIIRNDR